MYLNDIQDPERLVEVLGNVEVLGIAGGDGTGGLAMKVGVMNPNIKALVALGGGTTNTLLTALRRYPESPIPDDLKGTFQEDIYSARKYRPPIVIDERGRFYPVAYLLGACHLSIKTSELFERMRARDPNGNVQGSYIRAGIKSALVLFDSRFTPLKPTELRYEVDGEPRTDPEDLSYLALAVIGVPILATFKFINDIKNDKLRLLTLSGRDKMGLRARYVLALSVGAMFGVDWVIRWGLAESRDVDWVSFRPDQSSRHPSNVNMDGELSNLDCSVLITRSPEVLQRELSGENIQQELTIIIPRYLL